MDWIFKILWAFCFFLIAGIIFWIAGDFANEKKWVVRCHDGRVFDSPYQVFNSSNYLDLSNKCQGAFSSESVQSRQDNFKLIHEEHRSLREKTIIYFIAGITYLIVMSLILFINRFLYGGRGKAGILESSVDMVFKKDNAGKTLFYPLGIFGAGFILDSEEKESRIRGLYRGIYMTLLPLVVIIQLKVGVWLNLILLLIFFAWHYFVVKKITQGLQKLEMKLGFFQYYQGLAKNKSFGTLVFFLFVSLLFVALGVSLLASRERDIMAYLGVILFGLCALCSGYMLVLKMRNMYHNSKSRGERQ